MPRYAPSEQEDEQRRNAYVRRRRWWWIRGAHQREPIRSCSLTSSTKNGGIGERGTGGGKERRGGWEKERTSSRYKCSPREYHQSFALWPRNSLRAPFWSPLADFAVSKRTPCYQPPDREDSRPRSTTALTRDEIRDSPEEEEERTKAGPRGQTGPVLPWLHSVRQPSGRSPRQQDDDCEYYSANN